MKSLRRLLAVLLATVAAAAAHVGSPNAYYEGPAGPYAVRVVVRPPTAVPGQAEVTVTVAARDVARVTVLPVPASSAAALPPPDTAARVDAARGIYSAELWIMETGAHAIRVGVSGERGEGEAVVPINAVNRAPAEVALWARALLALLGVALLLGLCRIAAAAAREATLPPGATADEARRRRARAITAATAAVGVVAIASAWSSWRRTDQTYRSNALFEPLAVSARAAVEGELRRVHLSPPANERGARVWPRLATDHGKLMHAFLIRVPSLDTFAHVHPKPASDGTFGVTVPALPPGDYTLYADITEESGLSQTLSTDFTLPAAAEGALPGSMPAAEFTPDPDDSWYMAQPFFAGVGPTSASSAMASGFRMVWENPEAAADRDIGALRFAVLDAAGEPARLAPYMGMLGHAAVRRGDGSVFVHLHPTGSISMAAQEVLVRKNDPQAAVDHGAMDHSTMDHSKHGMNHGDPGTAQDHRVTFPFQFPRTGPYRIWVQVKVGGEVLTGVFDTAVTDADAS